MNMEWKEYIISLSKKLLGEDFYKDEIIQELIRCINCKHWIENSVAIEDYNSCERHCIITYKDDFCRQGINK